MSLARRISIVSTPEFGLPLFQKYENSSSFDISHKQSHTLSGPLCKDSATLNPFPSFALMSEIFFLLTNSLYNKTFKEPEDENKVSASFHEEFL